MNNNNNIIKTFDQLYDIEDKAYEDACRLDLLLMRIALRGIDGWLLIVAADYSSGMINGTYWLDEKTFKEWPEGYKDHMRRHYGLK